MQAAEVNPNVPWVVLYSYIKDEETDSGGRL